MPDETNSYKVCADNYVCHFANLLGGSILIPTLHGCYRRHQQNYFSSNQIIGGRLPTGDMSTHPEHENVRKSILLHLLRNHQQFVRLLSEPNFIITLLRISRPGEIMRIRKDYPEIFSSRGSSLLLRLAVISSLSRAFNWVKNRFLGVMEVYWRKKQIEIIE